MHLRSGVMGAGMQTLGPVKLAPPGGPFVVCLACMTNEGCVAKKACMPRKACVATEDQVVCLTCTAKQGMCCMAKKACVAEWGLVVCLTCTA